MRTPSERAALIARALGAHAVLDRMQSLHFRDAGHGYDDFGMHPSWVALGAALTRFPYETWFRVESEGIHHVPASGPGILVANHSGALPFDAAMLWRDVVERSHPVRVPRPVADHFVPKLPAVSTLFARVGVIGGNRGNVHHLLDRGELLMIFPEGTRGIGKPFRERHTLVGWTVGHAEMALRHKTPVIPAGIVGPGEQFPLLAKLPISLFGAPYLPVSALPLPLPVRYHIRYGEPMYLHRIFRSEDADNPDVVEQASALVASAVQRLVEEGVQARKGWF